MAKHVDPPEKQFEKTLDQLILLVLFGKAHLKVGRGISEILASDPAVAHVAQTFWGLTTTSHFDSAQLIAFKLFDSQRGTMLFRADAKIMHAGGSGDDPLKILQCHS